MVKASFKWYHIVGAIALGIVACDVVKRVYYDSHRAMISFAKENYEKPMRIAEIGVLWGTNSLRMFNNLNVETMYLIDPYLKYEGYNYGEVVILPTSFEPAMNVLKDFSDKVIPLQLTSEEAADKIPSDLDMVYIDGNHAYPYVKKDIELYYQKIKPGGLIGGHDIDQDDVRRAATEFADSHGLFMYEELQDWWMIKT